MSIITSETKQRIDAAITEGKRFSDNMEQLGLDMDTGVMLVRKKMDDLRAGQFKTLVMGKFKTGKSTLINCIVGKEMMASKAIICTGVVAVVEHGDNTDQAKLVFTDGHEEYMPLEQFSKEYQLSDEDYDSLESGIHPNRFADISHVVMCSNNKLFSDGFRLIDSPGWDMDNTPTQATYKYLLQADAIVFMLSAVSLFSEREREFIAETFANKGCRNLFFVVNRINQVAPIDLVESYVKPAVKNGLKKVFTDKNGVFDEELYNKRVFFVDAYSGYCARTKTPVSIMVGKKKILVEADIEDSGISEFEEALREFLNSDDRIHASIASFSELMTDSYRKICKQVALDQVAIRQTKEQQKNNYRLADEHLRKAEDSLLEIEARTNHEVNKLSTLLHEDLIRFIDQDMPKNFADYIASSDKIAEHISRINPIQKAAIRAIANSPIRGFENMLDRQCERWLFPIAEEIEHYIENQLHDWSKRAPVLMSNFLDDYLKETESAMEHYTTNLNEAEDIFALGDAENRGNMELSQFLTGNFDVVHVVDRILKPINPWGHFPLLAVMCCVDMSMVAFRTERKWSFALAAKVISAVGSDMNIEHSSREAFGVLSANIQRFGADFTGKIRQEFDVQVSPILETARRAITDTRNHMERILADDTRSQAEMEAEYLRKENCLHRMEESIHAVRAIIGE